MNMIFITYKTTDTAVISFVFSSWIISLIIIYALFYFNFLVIYDRICVKVISSTLLLMTEYTDIEKLVQFRNIWTDFTS
jgi:hypothetical protein